MNLKEVIIDPNFLIDILIRFILLSSLIYILYKFFLIDMTINYIIKAFQSHIDIYSNQIQDLKLQNKDYLNYSINTILESINVIKKSSIDTKTNDNNMMIIYFTMCFTFIIVVIGIIYMLNTIPYINYKNIFYSLIINTIFITVSQLLFFYLIYIYIDPIKVYNLLNFNYTITNPSATNTLPNNQTLPDSKVPQNTSTSELILRFIIIFIILFICLFILFSIISYVYKISLNIYIILSIIFILVFIILLLLFINQ